MQNLPPDHEVTRMLVVLRELAQGKHITLEPGVTLVMREDMAVGVSFHGSSKYIAEMTLSSFNMTLNRYEIETPT